MTSKYVLALTEQNNERVRNNDVAMLEKECKQLAEVWKDFQSRFPDLATSDLWYNGLPSIRTVRVVVESVVNQWKRKQDKGLRKAKNYLTSYCDTLLCHADLFAVFPQGEKYTCLFTGVLSTMVKASITWPTS